MNSRILRSVIAAFALALCGLVLGTASPAQAQQGEDPNTVFQSDLFEDMEYRMIGPYRGGRATAEHGFPDRPETFLVGTTGGGIWKTTDAGAHWVNISDGDFGGGIGEVTVAPSDPSVIYVGTGSACIRGNVSGGTGVYKSENGGESWEFVGLPESGQIGRIEVHPKNPDVAYVAALGTPFGKNEQRGVFKTTDGGDSWENVLFVNDSTGVVDLAMNPEQPNEVFAGSWAAEREPWTLQSGTTWNEGGGLYRTTDGGENWTHLQDGLPSGDEMIGKTAITVSPANTDRVWAMVSAMEPHGGVYRSDDGGDTWTRTNRNRKLRQREFYYTHIFAHPTDPNTVYALNTGMYRSVDGGETFDGIRVPHGDVHGLWINPEQPSHMVVTDDGGGQVTVNNGESWSTYHNQPTSEFYRVEVDNHWPYNVYGPQQDNSTMRVPSIRTQGEHYAQQWRSVGGGESGHIAIQSYGPDIVWAGSYGGVITRKNMSNGHSPNRVGYPQVAVGDAPKDFKYRFQWNAPIAVNPYDSTQVYHASQKLLRTDDGGMSWEEISPDLTYDDTTKQGPADGRVMKDRTGVEIYNTIFAVNPSVHGEGVIWVGTDDGRVWLTRNGGGTGNWTEITPSGLPQWSTVNMIEVSPHEAGTAYIAVYRYRQDDFTPYIYRTDNYGQSWSRIADGTRGIDSEHFIRAVREDPEREGLLYAGSERGMYVSFDDGAHWQELQLNLPETPITDLQVHRGDLVVATQGRSFWILDDLSPLRQLSDQVAQSDAHFYEPGDAIQWLNVDSPGNGSTGPNQRPEAPPEGAVFDYYLAEEATDDAPVQLEVVSPDGDVVRHWSTAAEPPEGGGGFFSSTLDESIPGEAGHHRVTWDFRYPGVTEKPDDVQMWGYTGGFPASPGTYTARMIAGGDTISHTFEVRKDPKLESVTNQELEEQEQFGRTIRDTLNSLYAHLQQIRDVREQVESTAEYASKAGAPESIQQTADELSATLDSLAYDLYQHQNESGQDAINYPPKLGSQFAAVYGVVIGGMSPPTDGARQRFQDLLPQWADIRSRIQQTMQQQVSSYNDQLEQAGMSGVIVPQP